MENLLNQKIEGLLSRTEKLEQNYHMLDKSIALSAHNQSKTMEIFEDVQRRLQLLEDDRYKREGYRNIFKSILDKSYFVIFLIIIFAILGLNNFVHDASHLMLKHFLGS